MALVLIEKDPKYYNNWAGKGLNAEKWGTYKVKLCSNIYIFSQQNVSVLVNLFWKTIGEKIPGENISVYIHFGGGNKGEKVITDIDMLLEEEKLNKRITVFYYSLGRNDPKGIKEIYAKCHKEKEFNAKGLLNIFNIKNSSQEKTIAAKKIENQILYITALMLLLKVNQTSILAASTLLAELKDGLSTMKNPGIDTTGLVNHLENTSLNDMLSAPDIKEMEKSCREILQKLKTERQSLGIEEQDIG